MSSFETLVWLHWMYYVFILNVFMHVCLGCHLLGSLLGGASWEMDVLIVLAAFGELPLSPFVIYQLPAICLLVICLSAACCPSLTACLLLLTCFWRQAFGDRLANICLQLNCHLLSATFLHLEGSVGSRQAAWGIWEVKCRHLLSFKVSVSRLVLFARCHESFILNV